MRKNLLMSDQTLFKSIDVFEIDYVPEIFNCRESQLDELAYQIRPAIEGWRALNAICRGPPGTGKTTSVLQIFAELEQTTQRVVPVYVNCQTDRTKYMVFSRIYAAIFGHVPPRSGVSLTSVIDAIGGALRRQKKSLIVCLDDANLLQYDNILGDVINSLLRLHQDYPGARAAVFATVSDMDLDLMNVLSRWVTSPFCPSDIYFPPYDADEIRGILRGADPAWSLSRCIPGSDTGRGSVSRRECGNRGHRGGGCPGAPHSRLHAWQSDTHGDMTMKCPIQSSPNASSRSAGSL